MNEENYQKLKKQLLTTIQQKGELQEKDYAGATNLLKQALKELGHQGLVFECGPGHWKIVSKTKEEGGLVG